MWDGRSVQTKRSGSTLVACTCDDFAFCSISGWRSLMSPRRIPSVEGGVIGARCVRLATDFNLLARRCACSSSSMRIATPDLGAKVTPDGQLAPPQISLVPRRYDIARMILYYPPMLRLFLPSFQRNRKSRVPRKGTRWSIQAIIQSGRVEPKRHNLRVEYAA